MLPISFDTIFWQNLHYNNIFVLALELLLAGGWLFLVYQLAPAVKDVWLDWRQGIFAAQNPQVLMEVIPPVDNDREIEAIEQIFTQIHGLHRKQSMWEIWWKGQYVLKVSLEMVSFEGKIKFFVRSTYKHMHLVEAAVYAQYPNAQVRVLRDEEDFVHFFPSQMPDKEFDMLGTEYVLSKPHYYPIKTYKEFQREYKKTRTRSGDYLDPMRHLWELMSNLKEGEYMWYQLALCPESDDWSLAQKRKAAAALSRGALGGGLSGAGGGEESKPEGILIMVTKNLLWILNNIFKALFSLPKECLRQLFVGTGGIVTSQLTKDTYQEFGRQLKGTGKEFGSQIICLHEAFWSQFRKKKPRPAHPPSPQDLKLENQISFQPNINIALPQSKAIPMMTEKQKAVIDAIERKLAKQIFRGTVRVLYFAKKPVFAKFRFWSEAHGVIKHFNDTDFNSFARGKYLKTTADYFFAKYRKKWRQNRIIANAKSRDWYAGDEYIYLSTEELATLWHFPRYKDLHVNLETAKETIRSPHYTERVREGYKRERLLDVDIGEVPGNLPVKEYEPYNYP